MLMIKKRCYRCLVDPLRPTCPEDISKPLKNSFIHTGHGSAFGESWGSPAYIDEMYLKNPMEPPDVTGLHVDPGPTPQLSNRRKTASKSCMCMSFFVAFPIHLFVHYY